MSRRARERGARRGIALTIAAALAGCGGTGGAPTPLARLGHTGALADGCAVLTTTDVSAALGDPVEVTSTTPAAGGRSTGCTWADGSAVRADLVLSDRDPAADLAKARAALGAGRRAVAGTRHGHAEVVVTAEGAPTSAVVLLTADGWYCSVAVRIPRGDPLRAARRLEDDLTGD